MPTTAAHHIATCLTLTKDIARSRSVEDIYAAALDALRDGLGVERASILLFDPDGVMRFKAWRGLSDEYRRAVEGHTPWRPDTVDPDPITVADVTADPALEPYWPVFAAEGIAALTFIPLTSLGRVIGKFMLYSAAPATPGTDDLQLACVVAAQVAFAIERTRTEAQARTSEERLRFALDAAAMGTWDWDLATNTVVWSDNLARIHGLPPDTFDGTFASYEREIHPADRERVFASIQKALTEGVPHDVEYRLVAPDGTIRWCEGKGRVEYEAGRPVRMTGVCVMVTRRKEAELARLSSAEESARLKDEFLATLSHELRTPLNAILGWVHLLQGDGATPDRVRQGTEVIGRNARLQAQLIEDILDVSRIITGKLEMERVPVPLAQVLETVVSAMEPEAAARRVAVRREIAPDLPPVLGDPKRLYQVFSNVLSNAVKFTAEGGDVALRCAEDGDMLTVDVLDTGEGITAEFLPYVFDRFRQADSRSTRAHGGLGLGLAIARHLVEMHGGTITAASDGPGRGTTVAIRLPASGLETRTSTERPVAAAEVRLDGIDVLVVDDQRDSREMLAMLLEGHGARVALCDGAEAALERLAAQPAGLIVADIAMPGIDGYDFMRRLRASGHRSPAIAVTAFAHHDDRQRALECGYTAYLAKPIDGVELTRMARQLVTTAAPAAS
jgi:PAS domain S-box-containing protein